MKKSVKTVLMTLFQGGNIVIAGLDKGLYLGFLENAMKVRTERIEAQRTMTENMYGITTYNNLFRIQHHKLNNVSQI
jgi:hypothetical protein